MALVWEPTDGRRENSESFVSLENDDCIDEKVDTEALVVSEPDVHGRGMSSLIQQMINHMLHLLETT